MEFNSSGRRSKLPAEDYSRASFVDTRTPPAGDVDAESAYGSRSMVSSRLPLESGNDSDGSASLDSREAGLNGQMQFGIQSAEDAQSSASRAGGSYVTS